MSYVTYSRAIPKRYKRGLVNEDEDDTGDAIGIGNGNGNPLQRRVIQVTRRQSLPKQNLRLQQDDPGPHHGDENQMVEVEVEGVDPLNQLLEPDIDLGQFHRQLYDEDHIPGPEEDDPIREHFEAGIQVHAPPNIVAEDNIQQPANLHQHEPAQPEYVPLQLLGREYEDRDNNDDYGNSPIYPGSDVLRKQAIEMVMSYILAHKHTGESLKDLLKMLNIFVPDIVPGTKYLFDKRFTNCSLEWEIHYFCGCCDSYVCKDGSHVIRECPICHRAFNSKQAYKNGNFFIYLPIIPQLKNLLGDSAISDQLIKKSTAVSSPDHICDIFDGRIMQNFISSGKLTDDDITLQWNCDGVKVFESKSDSLTPIQLVINELPPKLRKDHVLICGLHFGGKPQYEVYLQPLIEEAEKLHKEGFRWRCGERWIHSRAYFVVSPVDTIARAPLNNTKQFNGEFGCDWCYHPGKRIARGDGSARVYDYVTPRPTLRSKEEWRRDLLGDEDGNPLHGVQGPSVVEKLPNFDIVRGFVPDYMHCILLGVVRQLVFAMLDDTGEDYYIGNKIQTLNSRLLQCKPPREAGRPPQTLNSRKNYKANEWKQFLLYYSLVIFQGILPKEYLDHWFLLVFAMQILLQERIHRDSINNAELCLTKFVIRVEELYGLHACTFNVHQLLHVCNAVRDWGPSWAVSCFSFENNNHYIGQLHHGPRFVPQQICRNFLLWRDMPRRHKSRCSDAPARVQDFLHSLFNVPMIKRHQQVDEFHLFGVGVFKTLTATMRAAVMNYYGTLLACGRGFDMYDRFSYRGCLYNTSEYSRLTTRTNFYALRDDNAIICIDKIVLLRLCQHMDCEECPIIPSVFGKILDPVDNRTFSDAQVNVHSSFMTRVSQSETTVVFEAHRLARKAVFLSCRGKDYVFPLRGIHESD